ncbi:Phosphatidylcholine:ceramide cholinephosphotransferase, putative [Pediculus humanus corporis]|uniref:Phosphatidylcholine:ceramide cholinephosphotransferase, putative n=1 Tax=Pediculus humanus subsp. corporis TaxID=121224 RepID=E0VSX9_PEDHC|nr:Phosphatidylcholine:ceramide cholinephosphotransferase, putative [Pediculus humanus corporis]EEB16485.1 Phosphatidylcholine:ceramide cholinephosphotransferase, putative [Pediculus humanus corporis]
MVLDPSVNKSDYGTLSIVVEDPTMKKQDTIYQRQPLLPQQNSLALTIEDSDDEPETGSSRSQTNGRIINIKLPPPLKDEPRYPKEIFKTFLAFIIMSAGMILSTAVLSVVHERVPNLDVNQRNVSKPLPDVFLDNVPTNDTWALNSSEILIMISVNTCVVVIFFHKHRFIVARRVFLLMGILYLMRCITMYITVLPVASYTYKCSPPADNPNALMYLKRMWQLLTGFGLSINGKHTYCGDVIYSGHTLILVMSYLIITEYSPRKLVPLHWLSWAMSFFGIICVLIARGHYSIDVVVAYYVTTRLFWIYHTMACNAKFKELGPNNFLARVWWYPVFKYFEGNVAGPLPRQYDWPLPWPRRFLSKHPNRDS